MLRKIGKNLLLGKILGTVLVLLWLFPASGICFEVTSSVDKNRISKEDSILFNVVVKGGKARLDLSMIKDFKVLSSGTSSMRNYTNGKFEHKVTYQYVLVPLKKGELKIPPILASLDGQNLYTRPITILVQDQTMNPDEQRALFSVAQLSKNEIFLGEQVVYTLRFYTSKRYSGLGYETAPVFDGFSSKQFEKERNYGQNINGVQYQVTEVSHLLTPQAAGKFKIEPVALIANVIVQPRRDPSFDSFFNDTIFSTNSVKPVRIESNPLEIEVKPLAPYQGTSKFSGLVGTFEIKALMDLENIKAGESATLTLKIGGKGNIMDAGLPELNLDPDQFKVYDDNPVESISLTPSGYEGYKIFKKAIVPVRAGQFVIPPVELVYFDVDKKMYHSVKTLPIEMDVLPSEKTVLVQGGAPQKGDLSSQRAFKKEVQYENKDIFQIKEGLEVLKDNRPIPGLIFILYLIVPAVLFSGIRIFSGMNKKQIPIKKQMMEKAKLHLRQAGKTVSSGDLFLGHLNSALVALVLSKADKKGESVTRSEVHTILNHADVGDQEINQVVELFETIDSVRFGGMKIDENRAISLLDASRKIFKRLCVVLLCAGLFWNSAQNAIAADPATMFIDGTKQYKAGNFEAAAHSFEAVAQTGLQNPYLFYNIGNAYLKSDNIGHAILWYERARRLMPADPDLNFNLAHARTFVTDKKENSATVTDVLFFWKLRFPLKTLQTVCIASGFLFFLWASIEVLRSRRILSGVGAGLLIVFVFCLLITAETYYSGKARPGAVIVSPEAAVRSGVSETATKLFSLHEGTMVTIVDQKSGYLKIKFDKGKTGWVKSDQALVI